jgi:hypothetical protein
MGSDILRLPYYKILKAGTIILDTISAFRNAHPLYPLGEKTNAREPVGVV